MTATPIRSDLVDVEPLYFPIIGQRLYGSVSVLCEELGVDETYVRGEIAFAQLQGLDVVVCEQIAFGKPEDKVCAVLLLRPGGAVMFCCGILGHASPYRDFVDTVNESISRDPEFKGGLITIGEFRPNRKGGTQ